VSKSRRIGTGFESAIVGWLRGEGFDAERLTLSGNLDEGDVVVRDGAVTIIEAKAERSIDLSSYVNEAKVERDNYCRKRSLDPSAVDAVAVVKRRGKSIGEAYVVTTLDEYFA